MWLSLNVIPIEGNKKRIIIMFMLIQGSYKYFLLWLK